ncbi:MAG: serine/threonine-protein phosphatase [Muribaculaceae bacterium]|nr:serine/threonine-protein phosphatase [Muribaculaceae bacterium]
MKIKIASRLDIGKRRENNEDALAYCANLSEPEWREDDMCAYLPLGENGALAVVADGMGGANAGEVASSISIQTIRETFTIDRVSAAVKGGEETIKSLLLEAIKQADTAILQRIATDDGTQGMGTTIVVCWIVAGKAYIAWCGDSRCYSYNPTKGLKPLTHDHSLVQEMVDNGEITPEEAFSHPDGNIITRGLGDFGSEVNPDFVVHPVKGNETLMLCSDGLCGYCIDRAMEACMDQNHTDTSMCCQSLLQQALDAGGYDNISIITISLISDNQEQPSPITLMQSMKRRVFRFMNA